MQRPIEGQGDRDSRLVDLQAERRGPVPNLESRGLDRAHEVEHPSVLQPDLVVQEAAQLLGDLPYGALGTLRGLRPVVVDGAQPAIRHHGVQFGHLAQELSELVLPGVGEDEVVERLRGSALVGRRDVGT